ncbi:ABC transporter permease [Ulvibacterium marinum]|uniref:FtsX-like permease family protein n=1 Tax=Ulvibacterium marinum TaxID=2419782 RepID=A0A3B0CDX0_9FLAO|nr:ABC transporter permease [Ulvibacterium marinum]RKN82938.1 FtsX-like permease family protein [Ulvibacterium marinum]
MLRNYFKIAWRNLLKNKSSSFINIMGLTIGISTCMVILIFVRYESTFDAHHSNAEKTYRIVQRYSLPEETLYWNTTAYPLAEALRNDFPEIDVVTQISGPVSRVFQVEDNFGNVKRFEESQVLFVDAQYPKTFDVHWLAGDLNSALSGINSVVLTAELAKKFFGLEKENYNSILGRTIFLQSKDPFTVTGVVASPPGNSDHQYTMLIPYEFFKINNEYFSSNWSGNYQGTTFVVLRSAKIKEALEKKIAGWKKKYLNPEDDKRIAYALQPLKEIHNETLYGNSPGGYIMPANILNTALIVALFILLIAIINFVNLLTAQSNSRSKEVGIRKVMGGGRFNLIVQFIFENSLIIIGILALSVFIVRILLNFLNTNLSVIDLQLELGWSHVGILLFIGGLTLALAAVYPALVVSAFKPIQALRNSIRFSGTNRFNLRKSLVTFQFAVVQLFVIAAIVLAMQMNHFRETDLGFSSDAVVITETPEFEKLEVYRERLLGNSGINKVAFGSGPPMAVNGIQLGTNYRLPEQPEEEVMMAEMKIADIHYLDFYDMELVAGRNFLGNKEAFDEFIVNETLLKSYGWNAEEAIGKKIQINEGQATIVGVVKDFNNNSLQNEISPCILLNWTYYQSNAFIKISDANHLSLGVIKNIWEQTFNNSIYDYQFLEDSIEKEYAVENLVFTGFGIFSILAISIGCLGLFGLMSFMISKKAKEIGIRKVLGATLFENLSLFTKEYIGLVALAFLVAAPLVYYFMNQWLEGFTYRIELSFWMFLSGGFVTLIIAILTCSFQSIKAALANPIYALKEE